MAQRWSDDFLNGMRLVGDRTADSMVEKHLEGADALPATDKLMRTLFSAEDPLVALPPELHQFVGPSQEAAAGFDPDQMAKGQEMFWQHGPEIFFVLACYSLPAAYAARRGVQVLRDTGRLKEHPELRLLDTAQILTKMMGPSALDANHPGIVAARKVRLLHAVMRYRVERDPRFQWDPNQRDPGSDVPLGLPLNQEDLAGTLLVFSYAILDGLDTLGVRIEKSDRDAYMDVWHRLGPVLGVLPEMVPIDFDDARALTLRIHERQHGPSRAGQEMTTALLELMEGFLPFFLRTLPPAMVRYMLKQYPKVPGYIGVPRHRITETVIPVIVAAAGLVDRFLHESPVRRRMYRSVSARLIPELIDLMKNHRHEDFAIPPDLEREWLASRARAARGARRA